MIHILDIILILHHKEFRKVDFKSQDVWSSTQHKYALRMKWYFLCVIHYKKNKWNSFSLPQDSNFSDNHQFHYWSDRFLFLFRTSSAPAIHHSTWWWLSILNKKINIFKWLDRNSAYVKYKSSNLYSRKKFIR